MSCRDRYCIGLICIGQMEGGQELNRVRPTGVVQGAGEERDWEREEGIVNYKSGNQYRQDGERGQEVSLISVRPKVVQGKGGNGGYE